MIKLDKRRNDSNENLVRINDVVFAIHAFFISTFTLFQTFYYKVNTVKWINLLPLIITIIER